MEHNTSWVSRVLILENDETRLKQLEDVCKNLSIPSIQTGKNFEDVGSSLSTENCSLVIISDNFSTSLEQVIQHIKSQGLEANTPLILSTQNKDPSYIRKAMGLGIGSIITNAANQTLVTKAFNFCRRREESGKLKKILDKLSFFSELDEKERSSLLSATALRKFQAGEEIFAKGDSAEEFYVLIKGQVKALLWRDHKHMNEIDISEGSPFGEMAILDQMPRSAWCIASSDCLVLEIGRHIFDDKSLLIRHKICASLAVIFARRIRNMNNSLVKTCSNQPQEEKEEKKPLPPPPKKEVVEEKAPEKKEPIAAQKKEEPKAPKVEEEKEEEEQQDDQKPVNPYIEPTGVAENYHPKVDTQEAYDVLLKKIQLRTDFIAAKIPQAIADLVRNRMVGYWTGGKLAKINPHVHWNLKKMFTPGSTHTKRAFHVVAVYGKGLVAMKDAYLDLTFSHRVIGMEEIGCAGTFLGNTGMIDRFIEEQCLKNAIKLDLEIPIDRLWKRQEVIEFLTHTHTDVRDDTLFVVFDDKDGKNTKKIRDRFPMNQIVTIVKGTGFDPQDLPSIFSQPEEELEKEGVLLPKNQYEGKGFYQGQTVFLADLSPFYKDTSMNKSGHIFGTIAIFAQVGPNYSGVIWGSKGGAEGAVKAARAMFGVKGSSNPADLAAAVSWADG